MKTLFFRYVKYLFLKTLPIMCSVMMSAAVVPDQAAAATANGIIRQVGNYQVLNLWGSNYDMGYAHGYLLADKIRDLVDHYMVNTVAGSLSAYNALLAKDAGEFQWQQNSLDEIAGMVAGMADSGKNLYVASLGRNIDSRDIRALNLQEQFYFGCSSFGIWGNATADGETILARNLDFYYDPQGNNANYQMVIAYEPTDKIKFISFAWPGSVGVYSGMNENGVTAMVNTGNLSNPYNGPFHPIVEVYRTILETTTATNFFTQPLAVITSVHENPPEIIQMGISSQSLTNGDPVYYIEQSHDLDLIRYPVVKSYDHIIATNHFMSVIPPPSSGESLSRYNTIRNSLTSLYRSGDKKVNSTEAWSILGKVANIVAPTLTSVVIRPKAMEFDLSFAKMANGVFTASTAIPPQTFTWASLFPGHEPAPDLVVQSITANPPSPVAGQPVIMTVTVKNQGGADAGSFVVDYYRDLPTAPVPMQTGDSYCSRSSLAAGATDSCTFTAMFSAAGSYKMWSQADTGQLVAESDENNNVFGPQTLTVTTAAASSISGTITPAPSGAGTTVKLSQGALTIATVTASAGGTYTFTPVADGTYTVTPTRTGFSFTPSSATVTVNGAAVTGINFAATGLALDVTTYTDRSTATSTQITSPAFTTRAGNELLLAFISTDANGSSPNISVTGVTGGGLTWALVRRTNAQFGTAEIWRAYATASLTNVAVSATLSQSVAASITVVAFAGVNTTNPVGATGGGSGATGTPTASLTTQGANSWVFGVGNDWDRAVSRTVGNNQTIVHQYLLNNSTMGILGTMWVQRQNATAQPAGTVVTINDTSPNNDRWNLSIVEIRP